MSNIRRITRSRAGGMTVATRVAWRRGSADSRSFPHFVIIGAQRSATTAVYEWLSAHSSVQPALTKEIHYFDVNYDKGEGWYKAHYPLLREGMVTGEASPYMLFHPLAPARAATDLPSATKFIALLREPVSRVVSQYWHERSIGFETEPFERALSLEAERLRGTDELVAGGGRSRAHQHFSYVARSEYAGQLRRWFDAVSSERLLVVESERLLTDSATRAGLLEWLGLPPSQHSIPVVNSLPRPSDPDPQMVASLRGHFQPHNEELFELLGRELWIG